MCSSARRPSGYPANRCRSWCVAAGVVGLFGAVEAVEFSEFFFVAACFGGDGFQGEAELVDLDLECGESERVAAVLAVFFDDGAEFGAATASKATAGCAMTPSRCRRCWVRVTSAGQGVAGFGWSERWPVTRSCRSCTATWITAPGANAGRAVLTVVATTANSACQARACWLCRPWSGRRPVRVPCPVRHGHPMTGPLTGSTSQLPECRTGHLDVGRPESVSLIFDRRVSRCTPDTWRTRVITKGVDRTSLGLALPGEGDGGLLPAVVLVLYAGSPGSLCRPRRRPGVAHRPPAE
jgi:hypothetical protein